MRTFGLRGRVALVTGGSRGIGAAIVKALGEAGCSVAVNYRERAAEAETLAKAIVAAGGKAVAIAADVSKTDAVAAMVERASSELGPVDILVNNAGIAIVRGVDDLTEADFDETMLVNLKSAFLCTQAVLPGCGARRGRDRAALQCLQGRHRGSDPRLCRASRQGRHHRQCGRALPDRDRHDERPASAYQPHPARPLRPARGSGQGRDDADRQSLHDRADHRDERRHGVQLAHVSMNPSYRQCPHYYREADMGDALGHVS
jgi:hypothetical protein